VYAFNVFCLLARQSRAQEAELMQRGENFCQVETNIKTTRLASKSHTFSARSSQKNPISQWNANAQKLAVALHLTRLYFTLNTCSQRVAAPISIARWKLYWDIGLYQALS
jgi:hypothetical protein